jgi:aminomethyltransferase
MGLKTPLFEAHQRLGARIVPFAGWDMPVHYGSQVKEHEAVRKAAGMFDVSHMRPVDIAGVDATDYLQRLLANDVGRLTTPGKALYSCMLNPAGGVIDDLIVYHRGSLGYRLVVNAATADKDIAWMRAQAEGFTVGIDRRDDLGMIAVQGPAARSRTTALLPEGLQGSVGALKPFFAAEAGDWLVGRTGYTGEDGLEIMLPGAQATALWQGLLDAGVAPCGLGARDTLRLEAGMNLYGQDMDETTSPLTSGLGWTIAWEPAERGFIGREPLEQQRNDPSLPGQIGLLLIGRGVLRAHQPVLIGGESAGEVTSGGFAPTLGRSIALARVRPRPGAGLDQACTVMIRDKPVAARIVKPPFVRHGQPLIELD